MGATLNERFIEIVERRGQHTAFKVKRGGSWQSFSFDWGLEQAAKTAFGLKSLGYEKGSRIAILSENRPEWATTDFGALAAGLVGVPLYTTLIGEQIAYILHDAEAKVVFVSSMDHLSSVLSIRERVPSIEKIVVFYPENLEENNLVISLDTLKAMGDGHTVDDFVELSRRTQPEDLATIVYTSGTTGDPKGVALTHHNFMAEFDAIWQIFEGKEGDSLLSFLPLSHILQRVVDAFALLFGFTISYAESLETLGENLREICPTHIVAVPRVYEKIHGRIHAGVQQGSAVKRAIFNWAVNVGRRYSEAERSGRPGPALSIQQRIATALVFKKIHAATGGNIEFYVSTGAPLAKGLAEFFDALGIRIIEAWGMTEVTGAATSTTRTEVRFGSVGKPGPGVELKITDDGEICVRGDIVMREYWRKPEATAETIDSEGWLHTGDVGHIDDDGFLHITDRIKELIVTAGGKNVAPQPIENALKTHEFIAQAMAIGDRRNFISALIVPQAEVLESWAGENGIEGDLPTLCRDQRVIDHYQTALEAKMGTFSRYETVRKFTLVPDEFSQEAGELTPTLKLKRRVLLANYADVIDQMYPKTTG
ncbi:MAG: long-chain fatty acid--CoA ligase [Acidobacteria bacterium]|uniref:Long-chain fatty acid--CoA ligase n=1 Tax=Candidatus Sulfomarinibacter kjeldsenii TaxID=2885994 RepID=A0A8J7CND2_9BACT|nr:long-chain fatty acid--CoA ligase [Candidatus Sulfomarinibacter kjeldsenii]